MLKPAYPIDTDRLRLRPFAVDDFDALYAFHARPDVVRYLYWTQRSREEFQEVLERKMASSMIEREGDSINVAVVLRETNTVIGDVNLNWVSAEHGTGEIGFIFDPGHHGHGYAGEAARAMLRLGFTELGLHRIIGRCDGRNEASARVMDKLGMRREAHFVENELVKGEWTDEVVYAMLEREWHPLAGRS